MVTITVYRVSDSHGNSVEVAIDDSYDCIQICGLRDQGGETQYFESESYHVSSWADKHEFKVEIFDLNIDLDTKSVNWND